MINPTTTPFRRRPGTDCAPGCDFPFWASPGHPAYCRRSAGRGIIGYTPTGYEIEFSAAVASTRVCQDLDTVDEDAAPEVLRRHTNVVQVHTLLPRDADGTLNVDLRPGEARSFAAILIHAADIADGVTR